MTWIRIHFFQSRSRIRIRIRIKIKWILSTNNNLEKLHNRKEKGNFGLPKLVT